MELFYKVQIAFQILENFVLQAIAGAAISAVMQRYRYNSCLEKWDSGQKLNSMYYVYSF